MAIPATHGVRARSVRLLVVIAMLAAFVAVPQSAMAAFVITSETEPNGTPAEANLVVADASIAEAAISPAGDEDYFKYDLVAGTTYVIETGPSTTDLGTNYDIVMWLYDTDGTSQLAYDDDGGVSNYCYEEFTPSVTGTYYTKVRAFSHGSTTGIYGFRVREMGAPPVGGTATISGVVTDMDGALEGIEVQDYVVDPWFYQLDSGYLTAGPMAMTDADGMYEMTVGEGSHIVSFIDPTGEYYEQWFDGQPDMYSADAIVLAADESNTMVDALLEKIPPIATKVMATERASVDADGLEGNRGSRTSDVSADGRYVVFYSGSSDFVPGDENGNRDWFRKDMTTGEIELVNVATDGTQADRDYDGDGVAAISADGRYVAFDSDATNLVADDTNDTRDIFVRDMVDGVTMRVSVDSDGNESANFSWSPVMSGDGRYVAFNTSASFAADDSGEYDDVYVHDMETGDTNRVSVDSDGLEGVENSYDPSLSHDGSFVAFVTRNAFVADDTNDDWDVYVKDMSDDSYRRANVASDGTEANNGTSNPPSISADGSRVAFESYADNLVDGDMNDQVDIFVHDFNTAETMMVSVQSDGSQTWSEKWEADLSANGRFVAFTERDGGGMPPLGPSAGPAIGMDIENSLVPGDTNGNNDIILHDMADGSTTMVSVTPAGTNANSDSEGAAVSGDGSVVSFDSWADNIVVDDENEVRDVFAAHIEKAAMQPVDGPSRYETAIQISQDGWADSSSEYVVIATGENWPDALGGSALAGAYGAPVLLTSKTELLPEVADEIERLGATEIYVLGGTRALADGVSSALEALVGTDGSVMRLGGADRYETAEIVAEEVVATLGTDYDGTAFVATGLNFADALAGSPLAAANGWPVYLAPHPTISATTITAMQDAGVTDCILLGGDAAMPEGTNVILLAAGFDAIRIDGLDRYDTAAKVASYGVTDAGLGWNDVAIATGMTFPDALAGGAAQGQRGSVMLLTNQASVPSYTSDTLVDNKASIANVRFFGGLSAVSEAVRHEIHMLLH